jgi:glutamyl-tRNA synthetase
MRITRLAPSPTGALHLGNARTFLINWLMARQCGWKVVLRIEDLDGPRVKAGADRQAIDDLSWLGLDWDVGPIYQSSRAVIYQSAIEELMAAGLAYPCICTRRETDLAASAPHATDGAAVYPGTCRGRFGSMEQAKKESGRSPAVRFAVPSRIVTFDDALCGEQKIDCSTLGDFVIAKGDGTAAYHLAVVVDDAEMGITDVVRGNDLLESAARHLLLYEAMSLADRVPRWCHLPLVVGGDGLRLAKRHGDTRIETYRKHGVKAGRVGALLAKWCGMDCGEEITIEQMLERFDLGKVAREAIVFTAADHAFLMEG